MDFSRVQSIFRYDQCLKCKILNHSNINQRKNLFTVVAYDRRKSNGKKNPNYILKKRKKKKQKEKNRKIY